MLRERTRPRILFLVDALDHDYQSTITRGVMREAQRLKADVMTLVGGKMVFVNKHLEQRKFVYELAKPTDFDGVILLGTSLSSQEGHAAIAPLIIRFATLPMVSIGLDIGKGSTVLVDNTEGMTRITEHMIEMHQAKRFIYISGPKNNGEAKVRLKAFNAVLKKRGIEHPTPNTIHGAFTEASGEEVMADLLDKRKLDITEIDAVVCANDSMAVGAMDELVRRGYNIPSDVAIVGFDDINAARYAETPLTTIQQPLIMQGEQAVQRVLSEHTLIGSENTINITPKLIIRRSCGCGATAETPTLSSTPPGEVTQSLAKVVDAKRSKIETDIAAVAERGGVPRGWERNFMDKIIEACGGMGYRHVSEGVSKLVKRSIKEGEGVHVWAVTLSALEKHLWHLVNAGTENAARIEAIMHRARVAMSEATEHFHSTKVRELRNETAAFNQAAIELLTTLETDAMIEAVSDHLPKLGFSTCSISLFENYDKTAYMMDRFLILEKGNKIANVEKFPASAIAAPELTEDIPHALIIEPLCFYDEAFGVAALEYGPTEGVIYEEVGAFLSAAIKALLLSQESVRAKQKKKVETQIDPLTGIYSAAHFEQRLAAEIPRGEVGSTPVSIILLDMDDFQLLNTALGEVQGDKALMGIGETIKRCIKPWELVARIEEDTFAVLLPNAPKEQAIATADLISRRLKLALAFEFHGHIAASMGVETVIPSSVTSGEGMMEAAAHALSHAKRRGKDQVVHARNLS